MPDSHSTFTKSVNSLWTLKLFNEFDEQNKLVEKHLGAKMLRPNFNVTGNMSIWGSWDSKRRTLSINLQLLRDFRWNDVVVTLKHEMAHMVVDEIFAPQGIDSNGNPHGPLFQKACAVLELDEAQAVPRVSNSVGKEHLVGKIKKLLALGESNHEKEAEVALSKAHELMLRHNINMLDLPREGRTFTSRPAGKEWKAVPSYVKTLCRIINDYYFVDYIFCYGKTGRYVEFFGEPSNLDVAEYVFHFLLMEAEILWKDFKKEKAREKPRRYSEDEKVFRETIERMRSFISPAEYKKGLKLLAKPKYSKGAFIEGLYEGFSTTLKKRDDQLMEKVNPENNLPIGKKDPYLKDAYHHAYPNMRVWRSQTGYSGEGRAAGVELGKKIRVRKAVSRGKGVVRQIES